MKTSGLLLLIPLVLSQTLGATPETSLVSTNAPSLGSSSTNDGPRIKFDAANYSFGKIKQGQLVTHDFTFTNLGTALLEIVGVKPGCGCTTAGNWDSKVEPGKTGVIPLQFNSSGFGGPVSKQATVTCNDPSQSNIVLTLNGTVWKPFDIRPQMTSFQLDSENQTNETKRIRIISNLEEPVTLSDLKSSSPQLKAELKETTPGKEFELAVTTAPPLYKRVLLRQHQPEDLLLRLPCAQRNRLRFSS